MSYVPVQDLYNKTNSMYKLVVLASMRAVELNAGSPRMVEVDTEKVSSIALEEIAHDKVKLETGKKK